MPKMQYTPDVPMGLTVEQAAAELQISVTRAYELVASKVIPSLRPTPGVIRIPRRLLEQWLVDRAIEETYGQAQQQTVPPAVIRPQGTDLGGVAGKRGPRKRGGG